MNIEVAVVDYGVGNVGSILNTLRRMGVRASAENAPEVLSAAPRLILPGVGAFDTAIERLRADGMDEALRAAAQVGVPIFGICLGMQLLLEYSDEGVLSGLGLIAGTSRRLTSLDDQAGFRVPHVGWARIDTQKVSRFLPSLDSSYPYYFSHSYCVTPTNDEDCLGRTEYGSSFCAAIERDNVVGVQFHPEKSHKRGARLLWEFVKSESR